jgi:hypothetical protein
MNAKQKAKKFLLEKGQAGLPFKVHYADLDALAELLVEYAQQNTLNRDRVIEVVGEIIDRYNLLEYFGHSEQDTILNHFADALCSLSLPTLSEGEDYKCRICGDDLVDICGDCMEKEMDKAIKKLTKKE